MKLYSIITALLLIFLLFGSYRAQDEEIFVINESSVAFTGFYVKSTSDDEWISMKTESSSEDYYQSFTIVPNTFGDCRIDLKAVDDTEEYYWERIDACNAIEISIYFDEEGTTGYSVTYKETESEENEIEY
jgi:hypothetical protein